jgi:hypothetical protein
MQHVSEFLKNWNMIDESAELVNIKVDNKHWTYKKGNHPANPAQVRKLPPRLLQQRLGREHSPQHNNLAQLHHRLLDQPKKW